MLQDVRLLPADLSIDEIEAEMRSLRMAPLLEGCRGAEPMDIAAVAETVQALGAVVASTPAIREIDLNPVMVYPRGRARSRSTR